MNKRIAIAIAIVAAISIGCIGVLAYAHKAEVPSPLNVLLQESVDEKSDSGAKKAVGAERKVRSWEKGGTVVTLYEQDLELAYDYYSGPGSEEVLKAKPVNGSEVVLDRFESTEIKGKSVETVYISPLGTYVTAEVPGYESRYTYTYAAGTGEQVLDGGSKKVPYWTSDEKKIAVIQTDSGMDGTPTAFFYSDNGNLQDAKLLQEIPASSLTITEVVQNGTIVTVTMVSAGGYSGGRKYTLDLQDGTLTAR